MVINYLNHPETLTFSPTITSLVIYLYHHQLVVNQLVIFRCLGDVKDTTKCTSLHLFLKQSYEVDITILPL